MSNSSQPCPYVSHAMNWRTSVPVWTNVVESAPALGARAGLWTGAGGVATHDRNTGGDGRRRRIKRKTDTGTSETRTLIHTNPRTRQAYEHPSASPGQAR